MRGSKTFSLMISAMILALLFVNKAMGQGVKDMPFNVITYNIRMNPATDGLYYPSDHLPVLVEVEID